jgi:hypothetical protein
MAEMRHAYKISVCNLEGRYCLGDPGIDTKMILNGSQRNRGNGAD